ncbi:MAG: LuxR C-terminal-related transcriptional regulator [Acidimicrobiales bacterium]
MAAVDHLLAAGCQIEAADIVAENATELLNVGRVFTVRRYLDRLGDLVDEHRGLTAVNGWLSVVTGRFAEAERSLDILQRLDAGDDAGLLVSLSAMIHLARGDVASGLAIAEVDVSTTEPAYPMVLGAVRVMGGQFDEARPFLTRARELAARHPDHFVAAVAPAYEAVAEIESGRGQLAERLARSSLDYASAHRLQGAAQLALAHSVIARCADDPHAAWLAAHRSVQLARRSPEHVMLVYVLAAAADAAFAERRSEAEELLLEARTIADRCVDPGIAGRYLRRVEARYGKAERPMVDALVEDLTERELAVLRYLPSRLSQREIASELYVSLNTVKTHCKAIYRKLGVAGRTSAVQAARDHRLL